MYIGKYVAMSASEQQAVTLCNIIPTNGGNNFLRYAGTYLPV
jgi:hypothetical protein